MVRDPVSINLHDPPVRQFHQAETHTRCTSPPAVDMLAGCLADMQPRLGGIRGPDQLVRHLHIFLDLLE